ncbi:MAG: hypothetical protein ALECFALPRED_000251 [Alectoria fallacina]|uniref:Aminotransferase class I/classII large domain-containing protein n=1 Tax=Alectoria fallacina TaxID=1903189 RepID=A0A8H3JAF5_9LECA|nr:MAG: hypothetical protein ALECFALPRED_000251 [Alectoria fallacina]
MGSLPAPEAKKPINLLWGKPSPSLIPTDQMAVAAQKVFSNPTIAIAGMQYGDSPHAGYEPLRQRLSAYLCGFYGCPSDPSHLCITGGASQGLTVILQMLSDPIATKAVWMTAPCFFAARKVFEDGGLTGKLRGVNEFDDGSIDLKYLEREMAKLENQPKTNTACKPTAITQKSYTHLIYIVPTFSNPSGKTMPLACREALVSLARAHNALVISDDIYDMLQWPSTGNEFTSPISLSSISPIPRLIDIDHALPNHPSDPYGFRHTLSNGSFSKIVAPGVRTGWVDAAPALVRALAGCGATLAGGCPSQLVATMLAELMDHGWLEKHVRETLVPAYQRRRALMVEAVNRQLEGLGGGVAVINDGGPVGGYFVWVKLPERVKATDVARVAKEQEALVVSPGPLFGVAWDEQEMDLEGFLRLSFSYEDESNLTEGAMRLGNVVKNLLDTSDQMDSDSVNSRHLDSTGFGGKSDL